MWSTAEFVHVKSRCSFFSSLSYIRITIDGQHPLNGRFTSFITKYPETLCPNQYSIDGADKALPVTFVNIRELFRPIFCLWRRIWGCSDGTTLSEQPHRSPCAENYARRPT